MLGYFYKLFFYSLQAPSTEGNDLYTEINMLKDEIKKLTSENGEVKKNAELAYEAKLQTLVNQHESMAGEKDENSIQL